MSSLTILIIQSDIFWENKEQNLSMFEKKIMSIDESTELVVLPEMFSTGFIQKPELLAETMDGTTIDWMRTLAKKKNIVLTGSIIIKENEQYFNRLIWMLPNGQMGIYNKRHLFSYGGENMHFNKGEKRFIASVKGWKINLQICYDLRFPTWARQQVKDKEPEYDLLINVANWPEKRSHHWKALLQARAIENLSYVIGLNRVGVDGNNILYNGDSTVIDPLGNHLYEKAIAEDIFTITLKKENLQQIRDRYRFLDDADDFFNCYQLEYLSLKMPLHFPINFGLPINLHFIFESLGFLLGYQYYQKLRTHSQDKISESNRLWILLGACAGAFLGSRLIGCLEQPDGIFKTDNLWFYLVSSKTIVGGLMFGVLGVEITKKLIKEKYSSGDLITYPIILGMILGRIGCFTNGVYEPTFGIPTNSIFGMNLGDGIPRHPTELYEIVFLLLLWYLLIMLERKITFKPGTRFQLFMIGYFAYRFCVAFIQPRILVIGQLGTLQICCIAVWLYYYKTIGCLFFRQKDLLKLNSVTLEG